MPTSVAWRGATPASRWTAYLGGVRSGGKRGRGAAGTLVPPASSWRRQWLRFRKRKTRSRAAPSILCASVDCKDEGTRGRAALGLGRSHEWIPRTLSRNQRGRQRRARRTPTMPSRELRRAAPDQFYWTDRPQPVDRAARTTPGDPPVMSGMDAVSPGCTAASVNAEVGGFCCPAPPVPRLPSDARQRVRLHCHSHLRFGPITAVPCRAKTTPLPRTSSLVRPRNVGHRPREWWRRRVLPPGPQRLFRAAFIAIVDGLPPTPLI